MQWPSMQLSIANSSMMQPLDEVGGNTVHTSISKRCPTAKIKSANIISSVNFLANCQINSRQCFILYDGSRYTISSLCGCVCVWVVNRERAPLNKQINTTMSNASQLHFTSQLLNAFYTLLITDVIAQQQMQVAMMKRMQSETTVLLLSSAMPKASKQAHVLIKEL